MPLNLDAARRLHDRHAEYPDKCFSCGDPTNGYGEPWPCATAVALGATGRPEWDDTPVTSAGNDLCGAIRPEDHWGPDTELDRHHFPCVLRTNHTGYHRDVDRDEWSTESKTAVKRCGAIGGPNCYPCVLTFGHPYDCADVQGDTW